MSKHIKELTNVIYTSFKEDGHFENNFIDEGKFKARLYKLLSNESIYDEPELIADKAITIAFDLTKDIVRENVDNTLIELIERGLVREVITDDGEVGYIMNDN